MLSSGVMPPKLIATDLDGTLLRSDGTLSERTLAALRAAHAAGMHVVVATARPYRALAPLVEASPFDGWGVCQNGAVTYHLASREQVAIQAMEDGHARRIVAELRTAFDGVVFACEVDDAFSCEPGFRAGLQAMEPETVTYGDALDLITSPLTKLLAHHAATAPADLALAATRIAGEHGVVTYSGARFVEISAAGVTKAAGVAAVCERLGVDADAVVAFGDAHNDLAMLRWAGHRVAVANAGEDVLAEAHEVAPANDDDGVARVIERLLG
jgi:Cof subfamily protein (haloacid dehalogenase superfamily)